MLINLAVLLATVNQQMQIMNMFFPLSADNLEHNMFMSLLDHILLYADVDQGMMSSVRLLPMGTRHCDGLFWQCFQTSQSPKNMGQLYDRNNN